MIGENAMKDSELIQKMHSGNKEAVSIIVERYYADIYRFCLYMVQTENDAYDIAQETFLKFMKYGTSYKHHNCKFCSNGTPILKSAVHSFWFSGTRFLLKTVRFSFIIVM